MGRLEQIHERPREKVTKKGVAALSDIELLQLIIGSGTKRAHVNTIARRVDRLLKRHGVGVSPQQLGSITGVGPVRASQLLAGFELASRYLLKYATPLRSSEQQHRQLLTEKLRDTEYGYLTLDGAGRLLHHRKATFTPQGVEAIIRRLAIDGATDQAAQLCVGRYTSERLLIPSLADMRAAKLLASIGALFGFSTHYLLFNANDWHSVTKDVLHV